MSLDKSSRNLNIFNKNQVTVNNLVRKDEFFSTVLNSYEFKKRDTKKHFSVYQKFNECLYNDNDKHINNFPHLRVDSCKIRDPKKLNNTFKKEIPIKVIGRNRSDKIISVIPSQPFHSDKKINTNLHNHYLGFDSTNKSPQKDVIKEENQYDSIKGNLIVYRRFSLYLSDLLKKNNDKNISNPIKTKCFQDVGNEAKMSIEEFQKMIEINANKVLETIQKKEKFTFKYYRIKEAKVNSFFEEILDKIYRKIYVLNEENSILRRDYIINLIYSEIIDFTKNIDDQNNDTERFSVKKKIVFSKTLNLDEIKESENDNGHNTKSSFKISSNLKEVTNSRNNYLDKISKYSKSKTSFLFKSTNPISKYNAFDADMESKKKGNSLKSHSNLSRRKSNSVNDSDQNTINKDSIKNSKKTKDLKSNSINKALFRDKSAFSKKKSTSSTMFSSIKTKSRGKTKKKGKNISYDEDDFIDSKGKFRNNIVISNFMPTINWISPFKTIDSVGSKLFTLAKKNLETKESGSSNSSKSKDKNEKGDKEPSYICTELINSIKDNIVKKIEVEINIFTGTTENRYLKKKFFRRGGILIIKSDQYNNYELNDSIKDTKPINDEVEVNTNKDIDMNSTWGNNLKATLNLLDEYQFNEQFEFEEIKEDNERFEQRTKKEERLNAFYINLNEFRTRSSERRRVIDDLFRVVDNKPKQSLNDNILFN